MKSLPAITAAACLGFAGCDTFTAPLTSSGDFDPLRQPGSTTRLVSTQQGPNFNAGQFVRASMDNTAFFKNKPSGEADADKLLKRNTSMKVVSASGTYVKVELDSGEVGFVPAIMIEDPAAMLAQTPLPGSGVYQVYPPLPAGPGEPLPIIDPAGLPPEGAIPTVIDPDAPAVVEPVPSVTPTTDSFPTQPAVTPATETPPPNEPKVETVPLPPNGEEDKKE